jgi:hypothetical protein
MEKKAYSPGKNEVSSGGSITVGSTARGEEA